MMATSYNGWPASPDKNEIGVVKFGDAQGFPFPGGVKSGDVFAVLGYVMTQLHERVEACVEGWCWGYTYKANVNNPSQLSCHASATACDWNAPLHPNGSSGTFTQSQRGTIYAILDEVQGAVDWLEGYDEMHFEIAVDASTLARIAAGLPSSPPPAQGDWFDMATKDELAQVVAEQIQAYLPSIAIAVWTKGISDDTDAGKANALLAQAAHSAQSASDQCAQMPVAVWMQGITDDTDAGKANALLAKAANG
jgi:hypothetical protein